MDSSQLEKLGFSPNEATVYLALLEYGGLPASQLARLVHMSRVVVYQTLDSLSQAGFVEKRHIKRSSILWFYPVHPGKLCDLAQARADQAASLKSTITEHIGELISKYNYMQGRPNIRFHEGVEGLRYLYGDILENGSNIMLLRSPADNDFPEIRDIVMEQIQKQVQANIHTRAIVPEYTGPNYQSLQEYDAKNLTQRRTLSKSQFSLPAQIIVYGNRVGITSFGTTCNTSIIESREVADTFRAIFEILWITAKIPD